MSFEAFLQKFCDVALDPTGRGYRIVKGEEALSALRADYARRLPEFVPDLREQARLARLSGRVEKFSVTRQSAVGEQPVHSAARRDAANEAAATLVESL